MLPIIAIVGRPNVGKSTLFNRLLGRRRAIVEDMPGVTRDRHYAETNLDRKRVIIIDTGGIASSADDPLWSNVRAQSIVAIEEADMVLFVVDGQAGFLPDDQEIWNFLRKSDKPSLLLVNKIDGPKQETDALEFHSLGVETLYPISAEHGRGMDRLLDDIEAQFPDAPSAHAPEDKPREDGPIKVAIVGRPNVGKSSLINRLLGEERLVVSPIAGTTRDSIDTRAIVSGREYIFIDTAGIRRKRSIDEDVEKMGVAKSLKSLDRCDVAVLVLDGEEGVAEQDAKVIGFAHEKGRAVIVVVNKWDIAGQKHKAREEFEDQLDQKLNWLSYAPRMYLSAKTGMGAGRLLSSIQEAYASYLTRVPTGELNRAFEDAFKAHQPPVHRGNPIRIIYSTQVDVAPPTFALYTNYPEAIHFSYQRYLVNFLRNTFGFKGTPIKIFYRKRE
jgi:GTP-binding protein